MAPPAPVAERRTIVVPVIQDRQGRFLLCRMSEGRGVFPGLWSLPGGGLEAGERIDDALTREIREELGIEVAAARPAFFKDALVLKRLANGAQVEQHLIFLIYGCQTQAADVRLNEEFDAFAWILPVDFGNYPMAQLTRDTLREFLQLGSATSNGA